MTPIVKMTSARGASAPEGKKRDQMTCERSVTKVQCES